MIQLTLISVGTLKEEYLKSAYAEYKKRLSHKASDNVISVLRYKNFIILLFDVIAFFNYHLY